MLTSVEIVSLVLESIEAGGDTGGSNYYFFFIFPSKYPLTTRNFDGGVIKTIIKETGRDTGAQRW